MRSASAKLRCFLAAMRAAIICSIACGGCPPDPCKKAFGLRSSKPIREELEIATEGGPVRVIARHADLWEVALPQPRSSGLAIGLFASVSNAVTPCHSGRARRRTITIHSPDTSAAAPTRGLSFTEGGPFK